MLKTSRRTVAKVIADQLLNGASSEKLMQQLAGYLVKHGLTKQSDLYLRDIESLLATRGHSIVDVTTARELSDSLRKQITKAFAGQQSVVLREHIDESVIGGIRIQTSDKLFDATVSEKLRQLRA